MSSTDVADKFEPFVSICQRRMNDLVAKYGFQYVDTSFHGHECSVIYRKLPNVGLRVVYECGAGPFVMVTLRNHPDRKGNNSFEVSLDRLMQSKRPNWTPPKFDNSKAALMKVLDDAMKTMEIDLPELLQAHDGIGPKMRELMGWRT